MKTQKILAVALAATLGITLAVTDAHRHLLAAVWPFVTDFWAYYIAF